MNILFHRVFHFIQRDKYKHKRRYEPIEGDSVSRETDSMHTYEVNTFNYFNHRINFLENKSSYVKVVFHSFNLYVRIGLSFSAVVPAVTRLCTYYQLQGLVVTRVAAIERDRG